MENQQLAIDLGETAYLPGSLKTSIHPEAIFFSSKSAYRPWTTKTTTTKTSKQRQRQQGQRQRQWRQRRQQNNNKDNDNEVNKTKGSEYPSIQ